MATRNVETVRRALADPGLVDLRELEGALKGIRDVCTGNPKWKAKVVQEGLQALLLQLCDPSYSAVHELVLVLLTLLPSDAEARGSNVTGFNVMAPVIEEFLKGSSPKHVELALRALLQFQANLRMGNVEEVMSSICRQMHAPSSTRSLHLAVQLIGCIVEDPAAFAQLCDIHAATAGTELASTLFNALDETEEGHITMTALEVLYRMFSAALRSSQLIDNSTEYPAHISKLQQLMYSTESNVSFLAAICLCCHPLTLRLLARATPRQAADEHSDRPRTYSGQQPEPPLKYARTIQSERRDSQGHCVEAVRLLQTFVRNRAIPRITRRLRQFAELDSLLEDSTRANRAIACLLGVADADKTTLQACADHGTISCLLSVLNATRRGHDGTSKIGPGMPFVQLISSSMHLLSQVSTLEGSNRLLLNFEAIGSIEWAMKHTSGTSKHASCIFRDISRSTTVSKAYFNNPILLRPVVDALDALLASANALDKEEAHAICACIANSCVNSTAAKRFAVTNNVPEKLLQLFETSKVAAIAEVILKTLRNIALGAQSAVKANILSAISRQHFIQNLPTTDVQTQHLIFEVLRVCLVGVSKETALQLLDRATVQAVVGEALKQLQTCDRRETLLHVLTVISCLGAVLPDSVLQPQLRDQMSMKMAEFRESDDFLLRVHASHCFTELTNPSLN